MIAVVLPLAGCFSTDGSDVRRDISRWAYQNEPLPVASVHLIADTGAPPVTVGARVLPPQAVAFNAGTAGGSVASSDVPWRIPPACRVDFRNWRIRSATGEPIADQAAFLAFRPDCTAKSGLVAVAISGGGPKSAIYATEVLFELQRYGLAEDIDVVSSVSGGSYAAAVYAMSCQPPDDCARPENAGRSPWSYAAVTDRMAQEHFMRDFAFQSAARLPLRLFSRSNTSETYARILDHTYLADRDPVFSDLNPARPNLILNATNDTISRTDFDANAHIPYGFRRPLSDDDALHFSFTQPYFWRLLSNLDSYPLAYAVAASGAFPVVVDRIGLRQYSVPELVRLVGARSAIAGVEGDDIVGFPHRGRRQDGAPHAMPVPPAFLTIEDGGVHDNFGVTELKWLTECQFGLVVPGGILVDHAGLASAQRAGLAALYGRNCNRAAPPRIAPDSVLIIGINSTLLRSKGQQDDTPKPVHPLDLMLPYIKVSSTLSGVNQIMSASGEKRREALRELMAVLNRSAAATPWRGAVETDFDPNVPGPFRYLDIDIEATQQLYCEPQNWTDDRPLNTATGGSHAKRCRYLDGVLAWQNERNLALPVATDDFCRDGATPCAGIVALTGDRELALSEKAGPFLAGGKTIQVDPTNGRLLNNRLLFNALRDVGLINLPQRQIWLLRYAARWSVAQRLWELCFEGNQAVLHRMRKWDRVCRDRLPDRPTDDRLGSPRFRAEVGP